MRACACVCASMCVNTQKPKTLACTLIFMVICFAVVHVMHMWHSSDVLPMLNYGAPSWFYEDIMEFAKQTVVHELLLGLFAIVAISCMRL